MTGLHGPFHHHHFGAGDDGRQDAELESTRSLSPPRRIVAMTCGGMGSGVAFVTLQDSNTV